jgi:hypothetical protein
MADEAPEPVEVIRVAHNYGQVKVDIPGPVGPSDEVLQSAIGFMNRRIQNSVIEACENIAKEEGAEVVDEDKHPHAESDLHLDLPDGKRPAHVDCEFVVSLSEAAQAKVDTVIAEEVKKPLEGFLARMRSRASARQRRLDEAAEANFIQNVRAVIGGGMRGRGG